MRGQRQQRHGGQREERFPHNQLPSAGAPGVSAIVRVRRVPSANCRFSTSNGRAPFCHSAYSDFVMVTCCVTSAEPCAGRSMDTSRFWVVSVTMLRSATCVLCKELSWLL